jgi:hypothetical protein
MNVSAIEFGPDVDEFAVAGLTPAASVLVEAQRRKGPRLIATLTSEHL